jgi:hypothetical protein
MDQKGRDQYVSTFDATSWRPEQEGRMKRITAVIAMTTVMVL